MTPERDDILARGPRIFQTTALYYAQFRRPYPARLIEALVHDLHLVSGSNVVDLGCGTGELAIPLATFGVRILAIDPEPEMLAKGFAKVAASPDTKTPIHWCVGDDSAIADCVRSRSIDACVMGQSFHWMNRVQLLDQLNSIVRSDGGIAIVSGGESVWSDQQNGWSEVVRDLVVEALGPRRRAGASTYEHPKEPHEVVLRQSRFSQINEQKFHEEVSLSIEDIIGLQLSTSYASPGQLGSRMNEFCDELRKRLLAREPSGVFRYTEQTSYIVAHRPQI